MPQPNKSLEGTANSAAFIREACVVVAVRRRPSAPALGCYLVWQTNVLT